MTRGVLLDTCALIWTINKSKLAEHALEEIYVSAQEGLLFVNPMSAWEIAMLVSKNRISFSMSVEKWFDQVLQNPAFKLAELTTSALIDANQLPGKPPNDPVD